MEFFRTNENNDEKNTNEFYLDILIENSLFRFLLKFSY